MPICTFPFCVLGQSLYVHSRHSTTGIPKPVFLHSAADDIGILSIPLFGLGVVEAASCSVYQYTYDDMTNVIGCQRREVLCWANFAGTLGRVPASLVEPPAQYGGTYTACTLSEITRVHHVPVGVLELQNLLLEASGSASQVPARRVRG